MGVGILIYWKMTNPVKKCVSFKNGGAVGSCELDVDCNSANKAGICAKDATGNCVCSCFNGWSGPTCKVRGVPWDSPYCMGMNPQSPKNTKPGDLCACPNDNWESGTGPIKGGGSGHIVCLKCSGTGSDKWGPDPLVDKDDSACTAKWTTQNLLGQNCWVAGKGGNNASQCVDVMKNKMYTYPGPNGEIPSFQAATSFNGSINGWCGVVSNSNVCSCGLDSNSGSRGVCIGTAWIDPSTPNIATCGDPSVIAPRNCSLYTCQTPG